MGFLTRLLAGLVSAATLGAGLSGTANVVGTTTATAGTTGAVTATADDTDGRTVLECRQSGEGATGPYADKFCWIDWSNLPLDRTGEPTPVRISVPGGHIDADATITHTDNAALAVKDFTGSKWSRLTSAYKLTGGTALAFSGRMGGQDPAASVAFSNITPSADVTDTGVNVLKDFQLAFGDAEVMSGGVLQGHDVYERTDIESDKTLEKLGLVGSGDPNQSYSKANTGYGTTHVTLAGGPKGATDDANKDSKGSAVVGAKQASRFKVSFKQVNQHWDGWGSAIAVGVYMPYLATYPLTYDKNAAAASGEVPSNQRGKENTTQPAKTKTNGKIRLASDTSKLSDHLVNSDFEYLPDGGWKTVDAPSYMTNAYTSVDPNNGQYMRNAQHSDAGLAWVDWDGFDSSRFAWRTDQKGGQMQGGLKDHANAVELQQDSVDGNTKTRTTGSVRTVADRTASGLTVHDLKKGDIAPAQYGDFKFSTTDGVTAGQITDVNGFTVKTNWNPTVENQAYAGRILGTMYQPNKNGASLVLHHVGQWRDSSGTQRWLNAKITVNGQNLGSLVYYESQHKFLASYGKWDRHTSSRPYMDVTVDFLLDDGSTPQGLRGVTGFTDLDGGTSGYNEGVELVSGFDGAYVRSDAHLARFGTNGWAGATDENENNADAHGMKHYVGATFTGSSFHVRWSVASGQARGSGFQPVDSTIAYRLTYDKNAQDATGSIPSDTAANTTQPAKSETDGKVSDLVQRTTTHEDGSVTVRTVDTTTDVVSGCQVYYPAGQRITLATMAKDDDCWDSSMLSRPGHTQLGWNQDRNATQAQAEVTMVEGGMTVFAVWVGNPVLTYDTNKPSTWTGEMPSTPASVSVAYNTAAADGSGWQAGDVSKIRGYKFLGWYTGPQDNAGLYDWNTLLTGSVTVYAHWQRLQANVIYDKNGGTGSHANTTGWQYSDVTVPGDTSKSFKRDGYYFKYWNTQKDGKGTTYKDGGQVPLQDKDVTLYAIWAPYHTVITETGGVGLPVLVAAGMGLLVVGIGSTVMLTRRMRGEQ